MTILNQEPIMVVPTWVGVTVVISAIAVLVFLILAFTLAEYNHRTLGTICIILAVISIATAISVCSIPSTPDGRNRYEVLLDDTIPVKEICEKYNIIGQRGDIWVLEDKE